MKEHEKLCLMKKNNKRIVVKKNYWVLVVSVVYSQWPEKP